MENTQTLTTPVLVMLLCLVITITTQDWEILYIYRLYSFKIENSDALKSDELVKFRLQFAILKKFSSLLVLSSVKRQKNILGFLNPKVSATTFNCILAKQKQPKTTDK